MKFLKGGCPGCRWCPGQPAMSRLSPRQPPWPPRRSRSRNSGHRVQPQARGLRATLAGQGRVERLHPPVKTGPGQGRGGSPGCPLPPHSPSTSQHCPTPAALSPASLYGLGLRPLSVRGRPRVRAPPGLGSLREWGSLAKRPGSQSALWGALPSAHLKIKPVLATRHRKLNSPS